MQVLTFILGCILSFILGRISLKSHLDPARDTENEMDEKLRKQWENFLNYHGK